MDRASRYLYFKSFKQGNKSTARLKYIVEDNQNFPEINDYEKAKAWIKVNAIFNMSGFSAFYLIRDIWRKNINVSILALQAAFIKTAMMMKLYRIKSLRGQNAFEGYIAYNLPNCKAKQMPKGLVGQRLNTSHCSHNLHRS